LRETRARERERALLGTGRRPSTREREFIRNDTPYGDPGRREGGMEREREREREREKFY
jgi:hypothetical protein